MTNRYFPARMGTAILTMIFLAACAADNQQAFQATVPANQQNAPVYSPTPTFTPTLTPTLTPTFTQTPTPTFTLTPTLTPTPTITPSLTPTLTPTVPLLTLTPISSADAPASFVNDPAGFSPSEGWSCDDFPCADDVDGFLRRIRVPDGYTVSHVGRFPGQPMQIVYGPDGRLYATVLENGQRDGAVYVMNADGTTERYSGDFVSPIGLAFQPGTDVLYVSARVTLEQGGGLWRIPPGGGTPEPVVTDLPCCYSVIDNQPNGITFGPDGWLYMGIGALTDHAESPDPAHQPYANIGQREAAILRIQPHTGEVQTYAWGLRNPYDVAFDAYGRGYATDSGLVSGPGDRLVQLDAGANFGWPYWRNRGCGEECPATDFSATITPDMVKFPPYSLPRGLVAYTGTQFPRNLFNTLFVVLWNGTDDAQRVVRIGQTDPAFGRDDYVPEPFVTGLIRPIDVTIAPDGSLVVADFIYGHVWRVSYTGRSQVNVTLAVNTETPTPASSATPAASLTKPAISFATSTPRP